MTVHMSEKIMRPDFQGEFTASILAAALYKTPARKYFTYRLDEVK